MKFKKVYIVGIVAVIVGLITLTISFAMAGFDINHFTNVENMNEKNYIINTNPKVIEILDTNANINFSNSEDNKIHFSIYKGKDDNYDIENAKNKIYKISRNDKMIFKKIINFRIMNINTSPIINIEIPENSDLDINVRIKNSKVDIKNINILGDIKVITKNGLVVLNNVTTNKNIECETANGKVEVEDSKSNNISITSINGIIKTNKIQADENIYLNAKSGVVEFYKTKFGNSINVNTKFGIVKGSVYGNASDYNINTIFGNDNSINKKERKKNININKDISDFSIDYLGEFDK